MLHYSSFDLKFFTDSVVAEKRTQVCKLLLVYSGMLGSKIALRQTINMTDMHWNAFMRSKDGVVEYSGSISEAESRRYEINWMLKVFIQFSKPSDI